MTDIKQLLQDFERFAHGTSLHAAFSDLLDWTLLPFKMHDNVESQKQALNTYRNHPKVTQLVHLVTLIGDLSEGFSDPLGELYQQAISSGHNGQYWTPEHVCEMITAMMIGENSNNDEVICDPACGSGRMILAAAKFDRHHQFNGADLDINCCKMALLNMLLNSLTGEIAHMNSLSNQFFKGYKVSTILVDGFYTPYYTDFTEPELSYMWLKPMQKVEPKSKFNTPFEPAGISNPTVGIQGSLF